MAHAFTLWMIGEDCRRLASLLPASEPALIEALAHETAYARAGVLQPLDEAAVRPILEASRAEWSAAAAAGDDGTDWASAELLPRRSRTIVRRGAAVALALGALIRAAAEPPLLDLLVGAARGDTSARDRLAANHDGQIFRQVALAGQEAAFADYLRQAGSPERAGSELLAGLFQRSLLSAHTLIPDVDDIEGWLDRLFAAHDAMEHMIEQAADLAREPAAFDPALYRADDPVIALARRVERHGATVSDDLATAIAPAAAQSAYGQALVRGLEVLTTVSTWWREPASALRLPLPAVAR